MVRTYAEGRGLRVVGVWIAHEGVPGAGGKVGLEGGMGRVGERILGVVRGFEEGCFGMVVDNERLASGKAAYTIYLPISPSQSAPLKPLPHPTTSTSSPLPEPFTLDPSVPEKVLRAIREGRVFRLVRDLDDHLEDSTVDWLGNEDAKSALKRYLA